MYVTERFHEYKFPTMKNLPCPGCGKKVRRARTFTGTCNPFTTPAYMSREQMAEKRKPQIDAWLAEPVTCGKCAEAQS